MCQFLGHPVYRRRSLFPSIQWLLSACVPLNPCHRRRNNFGLLCLYARCSVQSRLWRHQQLLSDSIHAELSVNPVAHATCDNDAGGIDGMLKMKLNYMYYPVIRGGHASVLSIYPFALRCALYVCWLSMSVVVIN